VFCIASAAAVRSATIRAQSTSSGFSPGPSLPSRRATIECWQGGYLTAIINRPQYPWCWPSSN
jgi:hypothetical protein